jgi:hypothetical protein
VADGTVVGVELELLATGIGSTDCIAVVLVTAVSVVLPLGSEASGAAELASSEVGAWSDEQAFVPEIPKTIAIAAAARDSLEK